MSGLRNGWNLIVSNTMRNHDKNDKRKAFLLTKQEAGDIDIAICLASENLTLSEKQRLEKVRETLQRRWNF